MSRKKLTREEIKDLGLYKARAHEDGHTVIGCLINLEGFAMYIAPIEDLLNNTQIKLYNEEMITLHLVRVLVDSVEPYVNDFQEQGSGIAAKKELTREEIKNLGLFKARAHEDGREVIGCLINFEGYWMYIAPMEDLLNNTPFTLSNEEMVTLHFVRVLENSVEPYTGD